MSVLFQIKILTFTVVLLHWFSANRTIASNCSSSPNNLTDHKYKIEHLVHLLNLDGDEAGYFELEIYSDSNDAFVNLDWILETHEKSKHAFYSFQVEHGPTYSKEGNETSEERQLIVVVVQSNSSSFFSVLHDILDGHDHNIEELPQPSYHRHWKPKYFFVWPDVIDNADEEVSALEWFENERFPALIENISINDEIYIVTFSTQGQMSVWEIYSIGPTQFHHEIELQHCQIDWRFFNDKVSRRKNFESAAIRTIAPLDPLFDAEVKFDNSSGELKFQSGISVSMLKFLAEGLNFTALPIEGSWILEPVDSSNGTFGGNALEIKLGHADIAIEQTTMSSARRKQVHFLHPTYFDGIEAFFVQPPVSSARNLYLAPFSLDLWATMLSSWLLLIITMKICAWLKRLIVENDANDSEIIKDVFLWAIGAMCQQGWHVQPSSMSLRIIFMTGYFTGLVVFVAFSAAIVSLLSVKTVPIKTMKDLTDHSFHLFANSSSTSLDGLLHFIRNQPGYPLGTLVEDGHAIRQLTKSKSAILTYPDIFYVELKQAFESCSENEICGTYSSVPISKTPFRSGMMVNIKSPFIKIFNYQILLMRERGLNFRYILEYERKTQVKCLTFTTGFKQALGILDIVTALYILVLGYVSSLTALGVEIFISRSRMVVVLI